jgi:hypothetical protein
MTTTNHDLDHDDEWRLATGHDDNRPLHGSNSSSVAWGLSMSIDFASACVVFFLFIPFSDSIFPSLSCMLVTPAHACGGKAQP